MEPTNQTTPWHKKNVLGFTLIELIIIIVIIGILSISLIPRIRGAQDRARRVVITGLLRESFVQAQRYHIENNTYEGFCEQSAIQSIIQTLGGSGVASCYVFPNPSNFNPYLTHIEWGIAVKHRDIYYFADPQGLFMLDRTNALPNVTTWLVFMSTCDATGKKAPRVSSLRAMYNIRNGADYPSYFGPNPTLRSSTEDPRSWMSNFSWLTSMQAGMSVEGSKNGSMSLGRCATSLTT